MSNDVSRRARKQAETHARLLESAVALFVSQGYEATSVDDIADRADVARATAFNYFPKKETFLTAWVDTRRQRVREIVSASGARPMKTTTRLGKVFAGLADLYEKDATSRPMVRYWIKAGGPLLSGASRTAIAFSAIIDLGKTNGDIQKNVDSETAGLLLLDAYLGALYRWAAEEAPPSSLQESLDTTLSMIMAGLSK